MSRRTLRAVLCWAACATLAHSQHHHDLPPGAAKSAVKLLSGTGNLHHAVTTRSAEAQRFFNQGLTMIYGFNHGEAIRSFRRAAELDPKLAMAYWGVAVALGPNINAGMDPDKHKQAWEALTQARKLAPGASQRERDYIEALSARYNADPKADLEPLQRSYAEAMRKLAAKYPDDADAQTLFAESLMNLYPWKLWTLDGKPAPVTEEAVRTLERVLQTDPNHSGANHYYIHAIEASPWPQRALSSADRLGQLTPSMGHLVHMPAHIYMRTGDYDSAARVNIAAAAADKKYLEEGGVEGFNRALYAHNLHFLSAAYSMQGRYKDSQQAAEETVRVMAALVEAIPGFEGPVAASLLVPVRFRDWDTVLKATEPEARQLTLHNLWHFARGMAFAARNDLKSAMAARDSFRSGVAQLPKDRTYGTNLESDVMRLPMFLLDAKIALTRGDMPQAIGHLKEAVAAEDALAYNEPPDWYYPPGREALGGVLLKAGRHAEAEAVFREDLNRNQRNGRSLFGLTESLRAQGKSDESSLTEARYKIAWSKADKPLRVDDLF